MKPGTADGDDVVERRKVNLQGMMGKDKRKEKRGSWGGNFMMSIWDKLNKLKKKHLGRVIHYLFSVGHFQNHLSAS